MYVMCCPCCAAGDIARAAGRDYCMSCFVIPFCLGFIQPCWWSYDRQALASRLGLEDPFSGSGESDVAVSTLICTPALFQTNYALATPRFQMPQLAR